MLCYVMYGSFHVPAHRKKTGENITTAKLDGVVQMQVNEIWIWKYLIKAKFYYAILVADRPEAGRRATASWNLAYHALSSELAAS